jgi:hypothetical protein
MTSTKKWVMPKPSIGDIVVFSKDYQNFTDPTIGFVVAEPGDTTISILTFSPSGYALVHTSCHHKDDPGLLKDNGWQDLGVWDFAKSTEAVRELMGLTSSNGRKTSK